MKIRVKSRGSFSSESITRVHERLAMALEPNEAHIRLVQVQLEVEVPDREAFCRLDIQGERAWRVVVEEVDPRVEPALERASRRAARAVVERLNDRGYGRGGLRAWPSTRWC